MLQPELRNVRSSFLIGAGILTPELSLVSGLYLRYSEDTVKGEKWHFPGITTVQIVLFCCCLKREVFRRYHKWVLRKGHWEFKLTCQEMVLILPSHKKFLQKTGIWHQIYMFSDRDHISSWTLLIEVYFSSDFKTVSMF